VRALHQSGFAVTVGERAHIPRTSAVAFWSRHCAARFRYPDPRLEPDACAAALAAHFRANRYDAAIPVGLDMVELFVRHRDTFPVPTMLPPSESFGIAADKRRTFEHAAAVGIPIPRTVPARGWRSLSLPVIFKHPRTGVRMAHTEAEAEAWEKELSTEIEQYAVQEYIPGRNGFGYFGLFENGRETAYFMHERLAQFPREGGVSVAARAIHDSRLHLLGRRLLESLSWHGPAMVEFKRNDQDGEFYLMEINPKLWGSIDLAIHAGCNFPEWIACWLTGGTLPQPVDYRKGLVFQWVIPNGLKSFLLYPEFRGVFLRNLVAREVCTEVKWSDPLPAAAGLLAMVSNLLKR
jgi:predicted ATP-grasp superfamily ATP-dependent carboligase